MILLSLLALPGPYLAKIVFDHVLPSKDERMLTLLVALILIIQLIKFVLTNGIDYIFCKLSQGVLAKIKKDVFFNILILPLTFYDNTQTGYLLSRIAEVEALSFFLSGTLSRLVISVLEFIFCMIFLFYLSPRLALISLVTLPLFYVAATLYSKRIGRLARETYECAAATSHQIQDTLQGIDVIKSFGAEHREAKKVYRQFEEVEVVNIKRNVVITFALELLALLAAFGGYLILWYAGMGIMNGRFTVGMYIAFSAYLAQLYGPTKMFAGLRLSLQPAVVALDRIEGLMELDREDLEKGIRIDRINKGIDIIDGSFSYSNSPVFTEINLSIRQSERVQLIGCNGAGKSTLIKLILGLYKLQSGSLLIDDHDISQLSLSSLRNRISIVSQNTFLFNDTIRNNILYSNPNAKEDELKTAVELSGVSNIVRLLDKGLDSTTGERGIKLSGGERQKIAIARAILKPADLIIFDEATAHLDYDSDKAINGLLGAQFKDRMCLIVSHKAGRIPNVDKVYSIANGTVIKSHPL